MMRYFVKLNHGAKFATNVVPSATDESVRAIAAECGYVEVTAAEYAAFKVKRSQ